MVFQFYRALLYESSESRASCLSSSLLSQRRVTAPWGGHLALYCETLIDTDPESFLELLSPSFHQIFLCISIDISLKYFVFVDVKIYNSVGVLTTYQNIKVTFSQLKNNFPILSVMNICPYAVYLQILILLFYCFQKNIYSIVLLPCGIFVSHCSVYKNPLP